jgi:hypothetical protein
MSKAQITSIEEVKGAEQAEASRHSVPLWHNNDYILL